MVDRNICVPVWNYLEDFSGNTLSNSVWSEVVTATPHASKRIIISNTTGCPIYFSKGEAGKESDSGNCLLVPLDGINGEVDFHCDAGSRISIKAASSEISDGTLAVNALWGDK